MRRKFSLIAVVLLAALLTLNRLGASDVCGGSEAAMAVYVQQMVAHHQFLFPLDNCAIPMYKPPLYHWTAAALAALFQSPTATAFDLRCPSALYAIGGVIMTIWFADNLLDWPAAVLAGLVLCGSYQYISQARIGLVDMTLTWCETFSLYAFFHWFTLVRDRAKTSARRQTAAHYLFAGGMALGVLAKGPVGALLPGAAILFFLIIEQDHRTLLCLLKIGPLAFGLALASSWYTVCLLGRRYDFLHLQIGSENFGRFFGTLGKMPSWYYVRPLLFNSLPLSLCVPFAVAAALLPQCPVATSPAVLVSAKLYRASLGALAARLLAIFWICTVVFFEFAAFKRRAYLLPVWPAAAFLLAWWTVYRVLPFLDGRIGAMVYRAAVTTCLLLAAFNFFFLPAHELHECGAPFTFGSFFRWPSANFAGAESDYSNQPESYRPAALQINRLVPAQTPLYSFGFHDAVEPLVFYLGRCAPPLRDPAAVPAGAGIIAPTSVFANGLSEYQLIVLARLPYSREGLILLERKASAATFNSR